MDEKEKNQIHFTKQWTKFNSLYSFTDKDFVSHLLRCTNTDELDWKDKVVFEGGCGNGRNTLAALQLRIRHIIATDISEGGVKSTIENMQRYWIGESNRYEVYQTSLTKLEKELNNAYDIVFSVNCIPHISDYKNALKEMVRICKPNGLILFNVPPVRPKLVAEVDTRIREFSTKLQPKDLMEFAKLIVYFANKREIAQALAGKCELSGDLLSAYDHMGLPFTSEFTQEQITKDLKELGCEILKIDNRISVKARKL